MTKFMTYDYENALFVTGEDRHRVTLSVNIYRTNFEMEQIQPVGAGFDQYWYAVSLALRGKSMKANILDLQGNRYLGSSFFVPGTIRGNDNPLDLEYIHGIIMDTLMERGFDWVEMDLHNIRPWTIIEDTIVVPNVTFETNVGSQTRDFTCHIERQYAADEVFTWFERHVLGYKPYWYRLHFEPSEPIYQNRDKEFLGEPTDEGNDRTYSFSVGMGAINGKELRAVTRDVLRAKLMENLGTYHPNYKRVVKSEPGYVCRTISRRTLHMRKHDYTYEHFVLRYPMFGSEMSGYTTMLGFHIRNGENSLSLKFSLFGHSWTIGSAHWQKQMYERKVQHKPVYDPETDISFNDRWTSWQKDYPEEYIWANEWERGFGITRAEGLYIDRVNGYNRKKKSFNLLRNKLWNLI